MKNRKPVAAFAPHEVRRFTDPIALTAILFLTIIALDGIFYQSEVNALRVFYGLAGISHILIYRRLIGKSVFYRQRHCWSYALTGGIGLGLLPYILPDHLRHVFHIMVVLNALAIATVAGRFFSYISLSLILLTSLVGYRTYGVGLPLSFEFVEPFIIAVVALETYVRINQTSRQHIHRLETINKASRLLMQSLETEQVLSLLNATILDTLEADSYFIGIIKDDNLIRLELMYDDGEFFNGVTLPMDGTLSGWVIKNQRELFLPDLRDDVQLEGVELRVIGKDKTSLSWIGVPLKAANITGVMAMASYRPNAFDLADMELLSSLAQHVTLALDNTVRHAQVEEQARLDSLTGVFNHGYFLKKLAEQAETALASKTALSLIMLDIDYFKQYNDTYGHLVGDRILTSLCQVIKSHIKQGDAVGRWGGEEFVISLPKATGEQALQVAKRIGESMMLLRVEDRDQKAIPVPTVSQGIAVFPDEADEIYRLIDLADRRLYVAKERGRNQIEPEAGHWSKIRIKNN